MRADLERLQAAVRRLGHIAVTEPIERGLWMLRREVYRRGHRPPLGTILHSPSLAAIHAVRAADIQGALAEGMAQAERVLRDNPELRATLAEIRAGKLGA